MSRRRNSSLHHHKRRRRLRAERLEQRQLLAGDIGFGLHNSDQPTDVNGDGQTSAIDALGVVNYLTAEKYADGEGEITPSSAASPSKMVDVNNNGYVTALDALMVINALKFEGEINPPNSPLPPPLDFTLFAKGTSVDDDGFVGGVDLSNPGVDFNDPAAPFSIQENFKTLDPANPGFEYASVFNRAFRRDGALNQLTAGDVDTLLSRASAATRSDDAIITVVDRNGTILGVRVEDGVSSNLTDERLAFAIDGAVAKARTAAFFSNNQAPITSRTIRSLSQSTMIQRVVESSPVANDPRYVGPGFVAPIGVGGKFPPEVDFTPQVDLFAIEHQSRDSQRHAGPDQIKGNVDDFYLRTRFNADPAQVPSTAERFFQTWPEAYGIQTGDYLDAQSRGIATLPGGVPLYKLVTENGGQPLPAGTPLSEQINLVGGIGVFFPGEDGYATFEQDFQHGVNQSERARTNADKVLEAEFAAVIASAGGGLFNPFQSAFVRDLSEFNNNLPALPNFVLPTGRIDLVGITLEIFGPNPTREFPFPGIDRLIHVGRENFGGTPFISGNLRPINGSGDLLQAGQPVPEGWLVAPRDSQVSGLTADAVDKIIANGVVEAQRTRAAIRLDIDGGFRPGARTGMVLSVADTNGDLLGVYRMPDATIFSIDVSIAKARNTAYYADPTPGVLQDEDRLDFDIDGQFENISQSLTDSTGDTLPLGTALTNRSFRFVVEPRYPTGIEINPSAAVGLVNDPDLNLCDQKPVLCLQVAPQSILRMPGINPVTGENLVDSNPLAVEVYQFGPGDDPQGRNTFSVLAFDAFNQSRNFRDPGDAGVVIQGTATSEPLANQNGIVFFPGSTPLYLNEHSTELIGGFGVSGDGVDQDDVVTVAGQDGFAPPQAIRVDSYTVAGIRLPFQKFNRSPFSA